MLEKGTVEHGIIAFNAIWLTDNPLLNMEKMMMLVKKARGTRSYGCAALENGICFNGKIRCICNTALIAMGLWRGTDYCRRSLAVKL